MPSFSIMNRYQGEDIYFNIIYQKEDSVIEDWTGFENIKAFIYTDGCKIIKYSSSVETGYNQLTMTDPTTYRGIINSSDSKQLRPGAIIIEIKATIDEAQTYIEKKITCILLRKDFIKNS
jgi:hypothetical protein